MNAYFTSALLLFVSLTAFGQIKERREPMSLGNQNALVLIIPQTDAKLVEKTWQDFTKDELRTKTDWNRKEKEFFTDDVMVRGISTNTVDLHARTEQQGDDLEFILWINLGGAFLASDTHRDAFQEAEKLLMRFGLAIAKEKTKIDIGDQEKALKDLEKELDKLQKLNDRYHSDIEKAQEAIKAAEQEIVNNEQLQENMRQQIQEQEKLIEEIKKKLKDLK